MATTVEIKGMDKLLRKLKTLQELRGARRGLKAGALHVKGIISEYPPSTQANSPSMDRWYERGFGPRWRRRDGGVGGRKTSETLGRRWTLGERMAGLQQVIGNNASYAPWVHAAENVGSKGPQARFHGARGWLTDQRVIEQEGDQVVDFIKKEVDKELGG